MARCFFGSRAIAARTAAACSCRSTCAIRQFPTDVLVLTLIERLGRRLFGRHPIEADVDRDAIQPGAERRVPLEGVQGAVRAQERVLCEIARVLVIVHEAITDLIDLPAMPLDQHVERVRIAREALPDQCAASSVVVIGSPAPRDRPDAACRCSAILEESDRASADIDCSES